MNLTKKLTVKEKRSLFGRIGQLEENLLAVKQLRNAVSHHRMLFVYEDLYECYFEDGTIGDSLMDNIVNLRQLLNPYYREFFTKAINHSSVYEKDLTFVTTLPDKAILYF